MQKKQLELLNFVKENKAKFFGNIWRNYHNSFLLIEDQDDLMPRYLWDTMQDNISLAREVKVIYVALEKLCRFYYRNLWDSCKDRKEIKEFCLMLHGKYWKRWHKVYSDKAGKEGGWGGRLKMNYTQALKEFLAMGYVHKDDLTFNPDEHYCKKSIAPVGDLWWPEPFEHHIDAINFPRGISGLTGTTLKKR